MKPQTTSKNESPRKYGGGRAAAAALV